jgi:hypothetical protein
MHLLSNASKMLPCSNVKPLMVASSAELTESGLLSNPPEVAAIANSRLGHVGPGNEENHWSQIANSRAN